jgi:DDE superfamily endonuclease
VKGVTTCPNAILHGWLQLELCQILALFPAPPAFNPQENHARWQRWQEGLRIAPSLGNDLPPLRLLLVLDNLSGHHTPEFVIWLCEQGIMPLYTPLGGSWLNMTESIQRLLKRRALDGEHPHTPQQIITWLEDTAAAWNADPTPFIWGGKRKARRDRARHKRHALGGSGAYSSWPMRDRRASVHKRL